MKTTGLTTKLSSIAVLITAALLLELTTAVQYLSTRNGITRKLTEMAQHDLSETNRTTLLKLDVEEFTTKMLPTIERFTAIHATDSLRLYIGQMLDQQHEIVGFDYCDVVGPDRQRNGIYIYKNDEGKCAEHSIDFDYTQRSWYSEGLKGDGFWSEPYMSNYKVILMCTYSMPVRDEQGQTVAVFGADVSMRDLSALATQLFDNQQRSLLPIILLHGLGLLLLGFIIIHSVRSIRRLQVVGAEKERIANELAIAHRIQQAMLPKIFPPFPDRNDVDLYGALNPAREVGGDFYDFCLRDEKLFFCIGDVSGKGVPAALVMAMAISAFRMLSEHESAPELIISQMNDSMARDNDYNMFITLFIGVLDLTTGQLRYSNAGHKSPMIDSQPLPVIPNLPIGTLPDFQYAQQQMTIKAGSTIFLYTDGLTEAENDTKEQFGSQRMHTIIAKTLSDSASPKALIGQMTEAVHDFVGDTEQSDDLTMLAIRFKLKQCSNVLELESVKRQYHLTLPCDVKQTTRLAEWIEDICETAGISPSTTMQINLAIEEAVVNVMKYAYPNGSEGDVKLEAVTDTDWLTFTITDHGQPFDPTAQGEVDTTLPAEERALGGLGIHLMRKYMDSLSYKRLDNCNILTMRKHINH
ncbi:MAG: SpoIIE family protein phosphatase [Bacteroidales bacterium]|nr:SpoIIE family protein phosphatase [Bacteroidales bacterium]